MLNGVFGVIVFNLGGQQVTDNACLGDGEDSVHKLDLNYVLISLEFVKEYSWYDKFGG